MTALRLHPEDVQAIADIVRQSTRTVESPWLTAKEAAVYMRCPLSRVRKLTMTGDLPCEREGKRVLYERSKLDKFIRGGGARTV